MTHQQTRSLDSLPRFLIEGGVIKTNASVINRVRLEFKRANSHGSRTPKQLFRFHCHWHFVCNALWQPKSYREAARMNSIGTTRVEEVMVTAIVTVAETDKMDAVAKLFSEQDINAAPVVNQAGLCVGIVTSHDLVEYDSARKGIANDMTHGSFYDLAHYGTGAQLRSPGQYFDEVGFHMTKAIHTATQDDALSRVAREMCAKHIHHVLVLDENKTPIGMLSALDILGHITGEPVCRSANCD